MKSITKIPLSHRLQAKCFYCQKPIINNKRFFIKKDFSVFKVGQIFHKECFYEYNNYQFPQFKNT